MSEAPAPAGGGGGDRGPLAWFARNTVAANVLAAILLVGGLISALRIQQEVFPEITLDIVVIRVPYPGASPEEVEEGVVLVTEEAVRGVDGVKEVTATAAEGGGTVLVELLVGTDVDRALADVQSEVDRITSYPGQAERPEVFLATTRTRVISVVLHGDVGPRVLEELAEEARDELLQSPEITTVEVTGLPPPEIRVEVPAENLRRHGLTLEGIAARIGAASIDLPGGGVDAPGGEVLLRTTEKRERAQGYEDVVLRADPGGTVLRVGDVARVEDAFEEDGRAVWYDGERAVILDVYRVGEETPLDVADAVHAFVERWEERLPPAIGIDTWSDRAEFYRDRIRLLVRNGLYGLLLVLLVLGLFLETRLAFWVTLGIPISFCGGLLLMPSLDLSINMISLFAFIVVLGIVVDDAIIVGESIFLRRQQGMDRLRAAIEGVREVHVPVIFAVVTTMVAFAPMLAVTGFAGKLFRNIPLVVLPVLLFSLVESLFILPAHLAHSRPPSERGIFGRIHAVQQRFSRFVELLIDRSYVPSLAVAARRRYLTVAVAVAILLVTVGTILGGRIRFTFLPEIESDEVIAVLELPVGAPEEATRATAERIARAARRTLEALGDPARLSEGLFVQTGALSLSGEGGPTPGQAESGTHLAEVAVALIPAGERAFGAQDFARRWRAEIGELAGIDRFQIIAETGASGEAPIAFDLTHPDPEVLERAAERLAAGLREYPGVFDVDDGFEEGKEQLDVTLRPEARSLGLTERDVALQLRAAFFGAEALRLQRGRDEVKVQVRLPAEERASLQAVEDFLVRAPDGTELPLQVAADVRRGTAPTVIERKGGRRVAPVTADVDPAVANANEVTGAVTAEVLPALVEEFPRLSWELGGEQEEQREILGDLGVLFALAMLVIYALLAMVFRSYVQPLIIMAAIPFGLVGAVIGHLLLGYDLSLLSLFGVVALAGVVVNDSLLLVVAANHFRRTEGKPVEEAVVLAGSRRFRPILLTSLTTFFGLAPIIFETSLQARFLIPMALSLGFGVLFATFISLVLVPALYRILDDGTRGATKAGAWLKGRRRDEIRTAG